jgi:NADH-quinone oxidoreductase subunit N
MLDTKTVLQGLGWLAPEVALTALILLVVLADVFLRREKRPVGFLALVGTLAILAVALKGWEVYPGSLFGSSSPEGPQSAFGGAIAFDLYSLFFKILFLAAAAVAIVLTQPVVARWTSGHGETYALMLSCTLGMMLMAGANDLLMMYLTLEFVSVTSYILAGMRQKNRRSSEASLKYIIYGAAASGMMIYGMSFLYGLTGTLQVDEIGRRLAQAPVPMTMTLVISTFVMAGFGYKIAAAPFHMWCPDVYEGAPTPVTAFFSVGPKAAGFAMLVRFLAGVFQTGAPGEGGFDWQLVMAMLAVLTMAVGNFGALQQQNLKRLMAYSSIGHAGVMLLAFTVFQPDNVASVMLYLIVYVIMNLGAFAIVIALEEKYGIETVEGCRGLGWRAPWLCGLMTLFLISLTGLPPTAGFVGKLILFGRMIESGEARAIALVVIGVLFSVVSLYYYARLVSAMFLAKPREEGGPPRALSVPTWIVLWVMAAGTVAYGLFPASIIDLTQRAANGILTRI